MPKAKVFTPLQSLLNKQQKYNNNKSAKIHVGKMSTPKTLPATFKKTKTPKTFTPSTPAHNLSATSSVSSHKKAIEHLNKQVQKLQDSFRLLDVNTIKKMSNLVNHDRNSFIKLVGSSFRVGESGSTQVFKGLTKVLKHAFWPNTSEGWKREKDSVRGHMTYMPSGMIKARKCKLSGKEHGTLVHSELSRFIKRLCNTNKKKTSDNNKKTPAWVTSRMDPCTIRIINTLVFKKWFPFSSELAIYDENTGIATAIDLVVVDLTSKKIIILELKNGYESEEYGPHPRDQPMKAPLSDITNCPYNRHSIQLLTMILMLRDKYQYKVDEAYILRSCAKQKSAILMQLPKWAHNIDVHKRLVSKLTLKS